MIIERIFKIPQNNANCVHRQKEEKIRVLRQRLVERDVNTKSTELNGASGAGIAVGGSNGNGGTATTSLAVQSQAAAIISTAASAHPTPAATLAITQGKCTIKKIYI